MRNQPDYCRTVHQLQTADDTPTGIIKDLLALVASMTFTASLVVIGYIIAGLSS